jgi:hypothetical protein
MFSNFKKLSTTTQLRGKAVAIGVSAAALLMMATTAQANNLVLNGDFTATTAITATNASNSNGGELGYNLTATDWTTPTNGFNLLFTSGANAVAGINNSFGAPGFKLYGAPNLLATTAVPGGGSFVGLDGAYQIEPLEQSISGLTVGDTYSVTFDWAGAQQSGFTGATTEQLQVYFGCSLSKGACTDPTIAKDPNPNPAGDYSFTNTADTQSTGVLTNPQGGFTGWYSETMNFKATNSTEILAFLAVGTPTGEPPISLLTDVSLNVATPEPATLPLFLTGLMGGLGVLRSRKWLKR